MKTALLPFPGMSCWRSSPEAWKAGLMGLLKEQFDRAFLSVYHGIYDDYKSYFLSGGIFNVFLLWLEKGGTETPENVADRTKDILVK